MGYAQMSEIVKNTRVTEAYGRLRDEIRANRLPPGFQATEPEIAERLGMSRTPVREALIRLEAEGLVELVPRRGARVLPISPEDMAEIYDLLTALEPLAARLVANRKPTAEELEPLIQAIEDMEAALENEDLDNWAEADDRFHQALLRATGNERMHDFAMRLYDQAHRARMITLRMRDLPRQSTEEQRAILDCLFAGDGGKAEQLFLEHRQRVKSELMGLLNRLQITQL